VTRVALVVNPHAGHAERRAEAVVQAMRQAGAEAIVQSGTRGDLGELARRAAEDCDVVAALGDDGTVNAVATALAGSSTPLLVLPGGTLNHFARDLGVPLDPVEAALLVRDGVERKVDLAEVNGRVFVNTSSIGAYPVAVALRERLRERGVRNKWSAMVRAALRTFRRFPAMRVHIDGDDGAIVLETPFVFVGNNPYGGEGLLRLRRERLDTGRLGVITAAATSRRAVLRVVARAVLGRLDDAPEVWRGEFAAVTVNAVASSLLVALDGEVNRLQTPLHYRSRPGALVVIARPGSLSAGC
jgi:diacylglycerol kinase family enzyme